MSTTSELALAVRIHARVLELKRLAVVTAQIYAALRARLSERAVQHRRR